MEDDTPIPPEMELALKRVKLIKRENPMNLLNKLATIETRFNRIVPEKRRISVVFDAGGSKYHPVTVPAHFIVNTLEGRTLTAAELCEMMLHLWRMNNGDP